MSESVIRGIVFDMDGVLVDSHPAHRHAWKLFLSSVGSDASEEELDFILDGRRREEILRHFLGDLSSGQLRDYGHRKDEMFRKLGNSLQPIEGVSEFLGSVRRAGLKTAVATSGSSSRTRGTLTDLGLMASFDVIVTGEEVAVGKPDPTIYKLAAERLEESPSYLLAIEDAPSGVQSAIGAGMRCVGIGNADRALCLRAAGAKPVIPNLQGISLTDLEPLIELPHLQ
jgi:HAD superfamily hydrolase (TIGR01509 family)